MHTSLHTPGHGHQPDSGCQVQQLNFCADFLHSDLALFLDSGVGFRSASSSCIRNIVLGEFGAATAPRLVSMIPRIIRKLSPFCSPELWVSTGPTCQDGAKVWFLSVRLWTGLQWFQGSMESSRWSHVKN